MVTYRRIMCGGFNWDIFGSKQGRVEEIRY